MNQQNISGDTESTHSVADSSAAKNYLIELNKVLLSNDEIKVQLVSSESIDQYFENIRLVFKDFLQAISTTQDDDNQQALLVEMCKLNALYSIKLKLNYELTADLAEIAYDFDNPDYPGLVRIINKIKNKQYLIQTEKS